MKQSFFAFLLFFLLSCLCLVSACHDAERAALLDFKLLLRDPFKRLSTWTGKNCCSWQGVRCSVSRNIIVINLRNPNPENIGRNSNSKTFSPSNSTSTAIKGTISPSLFTLNHLRYLDLSYNDFMFSKLPVGLSNLTRLTYLNLSNAIFHDSVTKQLQNLTSLRFLDLSCANEITDLSTISLNLTSPPRVTFGSMSSFTYNGNLSSSNLDWLKGLRSLRELRLSGVDLSHASQSANWAEPLSVLSNLISLHLSNCRISGVIPLDQLLNLTHLYSLVMDSNYLTSSIPDQLANLTSLSYLDFRNSNIDGSIPYLPQLKGLFVGSNPGITINLNSMFAVPWPHLEVLFMQYTQAHGSIPDSLANTTSLVYFVAENCSIQGPVPSSITNLSRLEILDLSLNNIVGNLPPSLSNLRSLQSLTLFQNSLKGNIPDSICEIPSLLSLNLAKNQLTGDLPECVSRLPNLTTLDVFANNLNGIIPMYLFQKPSVNILSLGSSGLTIKLDKIDVSPNFNPVVLELTSCNIGGRIPDFISNLTQLMLLDLANNSLSGPIPSWLFNLPSLSFLDLSMNNLQGHLPPIIQLHSSWWPSTLYLASNTLQGSIPRHLKNVDVIDLSGNNFTGNIPDEIGRLPTIRYISFYSNNLVGPVPLSFCRTSNLLMLLDLSNNNLSGTIPPSLGNCTSLISLNLGGNNFGGSIPNELKGAKSLTYLDLSYNHFSGSFPRVVRKLPRIEFVNFANNRFGGWIPKFIGDLHSLRILMLSSNFFNGSIPQEINNLEKLQYIGFSNNQLSGLIPPKLDGLNTLRSRPKDGLIIGSVISLSFAGVQLDVVTKGSSHLYEVVHTYNSGLDLSCNSLTGEIPFEIGLLRGLYMLNLSHNGFSGNIPLSIGEMSGLESLDLSFNNISGEIPITMAILDSLSFLNLSYNNLSGNIPRNSHFDTLSGNGLSAYTGNKFLCGIPGGMNCEGNHSYSTETTITKDDQFFFYGSVMIGFGVGLSGFFLVLQLMKDKWRSRYWRIIDKLVLRIIHCI